MSADRHVGIWNETGRLAWPSLGLAAAVSIGMIAVELGEMVRAARIDRPISDFQPPAPILAPVMASHGNHQENAAKLLARPLFSRNRRPPAEDPHPVAGPPSSLPRLTGVVVSPAGKFAIFASAGGGRPVVIAEGDHLGAAVIDAIAAGEVNVHGPDGTLVLHSTFDQIAQAAPPNPTTPALRRLPMPLRPASRVTNKSP